MGNLALPHLQPLKLKTVLGGLEHHRFLTLQELPLLDRRPPQQCKGSLAQLHLLLQGSALGLELPRALLRGLATMICFPSLLQSLGAGLPRGRKGCLGLHVVKLALIAREVDCNLQLASLLNQPQALSFKTRVRIRKLSTKLAHHVHRLSKELSANERNSR